MRSNKMWIAYYPFHTKYKYIYARIEINKYNITINKYKNYITINNKNGKK
jgi:hypothetical protein